MQNLLLAKYVKPMIIECATKLTTEWSEEDAMKLYEALGDYFEVATGSDLSRAPVEAPKPVRIEVPSESVCFPTVEEPKRKKRNTPDRYRDRKTANARYQRLFDLLTSEGNLGKEVQVKPEDIDPDCTMEELQYICERFNSATWRHKNASGTKLMYRKQLFNFACRFVRADQDLRTLRWGNRN